MRHARAAGRGRGRAAAFAVVLLAATLAGCSGGGGPALGAAPAPPGGASQPSGAVTVRAATSSLGRILVDGNGMTLYRYTADTRARTDCNEECLYLWPPVLLTARVPKAGPGLSGRLGVVTDSIGQQQVTYDGWPLYTYLLDTRPGQARGQGKRDSLGTWRVVFANPSKNPTPRP